MMRLIILFLTTLLLAACARSNRYDNLKAVPLEQVPAAMQGRAIVQAPCIGIAFGGGGVRGFMHLGVMRALEEAGIRADIVTGASAGAAAAALYASGLSQREIETHIFSASEYELADLVLSRQGVLNGQAFAAWIREATGHRQIRDLPVALGIAVTDLGKGQALLVVDGDPGEAVQASASVPGTVIPVESGGATLIDGGVLALVPVRFARSMGADIVIGIDIYCGNDTIPKGHALDTMLRTFRLQSCKLSEKEAAEADFLIRPSFEPASPTSFSQRDEAIQAGYRAAQAIMPALHARLMAPC
jgi:NTE family protein